MHTNADSINTVYSQAVYTGYIKMIDFFQDTKTVFSAI